MPIATTAAGPVHGHRVTTSDGQSVVHFGGVPYASAARFGLPSAPSPWTFPLDCTLSGAAPPQRSELDLVPGMVPLRTSEDCLTAEVWTPGVDGRRPIIVWIPGGSFRIGGAGLATYDGRRLAADGDAVIIGLNYRLGALGFLAAPGVPSNLGLRDLLAGIDWVRANAAAFGGDPERITLMGESAGAGAIYHLLTRPDLPCAGAIIWSGSPTMTLAASTAELVGTRFTSLAGVADTSALADLPLDALLDAQAATVTDLARTVGMMPFHPWVDGDRVPQSPLDAAAAGRLTAIPLVIGTTADEMELFRSMVPALPRSYAVPMLTTKAAAVGITVTGVEAGLTACGDDLVTAIADVDLQLPALLVANSHLRRGLPVWRATLTWPSRDHGSCHALDLPFHFGTLDVDGWQAFAGADGALTEAADRLSSRMRSAWASFAATGQPSCEPIGVWPAFDGTGTIVGLDSEVAVVVDPAFRRLRSWNDR